MRMLLVAGAALALLATACAREEVPPANDNDVDEVAVCLEGETFIEDGDFPLEPSAEGDARKIGELRWEPHEGCERFVIDLWGPDDAPAASPGPVEAEVIRELGIVRVTFPDVDDLDPVDQDATDATFDGELAAAAYVVLGGDREVFGDLHLATEAEVHVALLEDPARVVVDLRPGGSPVPEPAATNDRVVVLEPRPGEHTYPLTVTGYSRTFEANVVVRIEQDGEEAFEDFTTATGWAEAWGFYELSVEEGPTGEMELHVGEHSARDGTWQGAVVQLTVP